MLCMNYSIIYTFSPQGQHSTTATPEPQGRHHRVATAGSPPLGHHRRVATAEPPPQSRRVSTAGSPPQGLHRRVSTAGPPPQGHRAATAGTAAKGRHDRAALHWWHYLISSSLFYYLNGHCSKFATRHKNMSSSTPTFLIFHKDQSQKVWWKKITIDKVTQLFHESDTPIEYKNTWFQQTLNNFVIFFHQIFRDWSLWKMYWYVKRACLVKFLMACS